MKNCKQCDKAKPLSEYYKHKDMSDGHLNICKECKRSYAREQDTKERDYIRQRISFKRIFQHRYGSMKQRVDGKATRKYRVEGYDICTKEQFYEWCQDNSNMNKFKKLHKEWEISGFDRKLTPSIDRINNNRGYTVDNMQWITLTNNSRKYTKEPF